MTKRTPEELTEIAKKIHSGAIFTSAAIHQRDAHMLGTIFMPILFAGEELLDSWKVNPPEVIFAEMSKALPRGVNGYPMFGECAFLDKEEWQFALSKIKKIEEAMATI